MNVMSAESFKYVSSMICYIKYPEVILIYLCLGFVEGRNPNEVLKESHAASNVLFSKRQSIYFSSVERWTSVP